MNTRVGVERSVARFRFQRGFGGRAGDDIDHAAERVRSPQARAATAHDLNALDILQRHAIPLHEARESVVDRNAVDQHERVTRYPALQAAHRDDSRGRVVLVRGDQRHLHARAAQDLVDRLTRACRDFLAGDDRNARGNIG